MGLKQSRWRAHPRLALDFPCTVGDRMGRVGVLPRV